MRARGGIEALQEEVILLGVDWMRTDTFMLQPALSPQLGREDIEGQNEEAVASARMQAAGRPVVGVIGPSLDPLSYRMQLRVLVPAVDGLLIETLTGLPSLRAAAVAIRTLENEGMTIPPLMVSASPTLSHTLIDGSSLAAYAEEALGMKPIAIGLNCGYGAEPMVPALEQLYEAVKGRAALLASPSAGIPSQGAYPDTAETMVQQLRPLLQKGLLRIIGGCCGTTPKYLQALQQLIHRNGQLIADANPTAIERDFDNP